MDKEMWLLISTAILVLMSHFSLLGIIPQLTPEYNTCTNDTEVLSLPVRTHGQLMRFPWARLWYCLRAIDSFGSGLIKVVSWTQIERLLGCAGSTLYQWLREAREAGAIYKYKRTGDRLTIYLGGLFNVCRTLGLENWGAVAVLPLKQVLTQCRQLATAICTQQLQGQSRYAAHKSLNQAEKKVFTMPNALDVIQVGRNASFKPDRGATKIPYLLHVGEKRAFVSKGFIPFGVSQGAIASELAISDRTVRRHLSDLEVTSRQLVQAKDAYRYIKAGIQLMDDYCLGEPGIWYEQKDREIILHEPNGLTNSKRKGGHSIPMTGNSLHPECDRFFSYFGKTWIYRCNLYALTHELKAMRVARRKYRRSLAKDKLNLSPKPGDPGIFPI
jgi:hypothetical protein